MKKKTYYLSQEEKRQLRTKIEEILKGQEKVEFAYLYGSFVEDLPFHDVDLGVYVAEIKESEATSYDIFLAQKLSSKLQVPIDVRILNFAPVSFRYHVFRGELVSGRNEEVRSQVVERTIQKYLDLKPILYKSMKEAFAA